VTPVAAPPLPDQKTKGWEFTDLTGLDIDAYTPAEGEVEGLDTGNEVSGAGSADALEGPVVMSLAAAAEQFPEIVEPRLGSLVPGDDPFVARNTEAWTQGAFIYVPKGQRLEPVHLAVRQLGDRSALNWRVLIVLEEQAEAEVWETYTSDGSAGEQLDGLFNGVVEIVVGAGATLRYISRQELSERSWVFGTQRAEVDRDGTLDWVALGFGSAHGKVRMETRLAGAGSRARVTGAYAGNGSQHLDFDTKQEHAAPNTTSDLAFRGVLTDSATAVWRGMIRVDPGAQQTDAFQESRNLLLSKKSHADAIPGLEIEANDVRCTHAAAVAQVDAEQLYYLRSRGLGDAEAKGMIIDGFLQELVERLAEGPIRESVSEALETRLAELLA
jgi:Fe-S cluster assembly protein SufD